MENSPRSNQTVTTTQSSITILDSLKDRPGQTLAELTDKLDLARSTIHRHLLTLEDNDLVYRDELSGAFYLGLRFLDFGCRSRERIKFFDIGRKKVVRLAEESGEKVWLIAKDGDFSIHLFKAYGDKPLETSAKVGQRRHLHQLAAGKSILAHIPADELDAIIDRRGLPKATENTITEEKQLRDELAEIKEQGFALNIGESVIGLNAIGASIRDEHGYPVGAISLSGPAHRLNRSLLANEMSNKLLASIDEIQIHLRHASGGQN